MATTLDRTQVSPRPEHPARGRVVNRLIGVGFGAAAIFNAVVTLPGAPDFLKWSADSAWLPPYRWLLQHLVERAPAVVGATVIFEAAVAAMLITRWHERLGLALATLWVLGLIPALAWPYWLVNVALAVLFGALWWRSRKAAALND
jgi:hypothetical protein